jgi:hypothetical protein
MSLPDDTEDVYNILAASGAISFAEQFVWNAREWGATYGQIGSTLNTPLKGLKADQVRTIHQKTRRKIEKYRKARFTVTPAEARYLVKVLTQVKDAL